ncbi:hypothetical protein SAY86_013600 [Trapa natans]|uniref:Uncharacterized protein n=1 Tax=Trapa natans TaxID=22666 RepID=A0AAN7KRU0_TRANT|nr:hypothetical protein SAY86_013600 [Trapa natans]
MQQQNRHHKFDYYQYYRNPHMELFDLIIKRIYVYNGSNKLRSTKKRGRAEKLAVILWLKDERGRQLEQIDEDAESRQPRRRRLKGNLRWRCDEVGEMDEKEEKEKMPVAGCPAEQRGGTPGKEASKNLYRNLKTVLSWLMDNDVLLPPMTKVYCNEIADGNLMEDCLQGEGINCDLNRFDMEWLNSGHQRA